jgi:hypothetical protein
MRIRDTMIGLGLVLAATSMCRAEVDLTGDWTGQFKGKAVIKRDQGNWHIEADWGPDNHYIVDAILNGDTLTGSWCGSAARTAKDPRGTKRHRWAATVSADGNTITPTSKIEDAGKSHWAWGKLSRSK